MSRRAVVSVGVALTVLSVMGLTVFFVTVGLDKADKWASAIGVLIAIAGLAIAIAGLVRSEGGTEHTHQPSPGSGVNIAGRNIYRADGNMTVNNHPDSSG